MLKNLFLRICLTFIIAVNFSHSQSMSLKELATSEPAKIFCATTALLGSSLLCPIIAKCEMKRIQLEFEDKTYTQIIRTEAPNLLSRFLKESLPISLVTAGYSYFDFSPKITLLSLITSGITVALFSIYDHGNSYQKEAPDYPGGLEAKVRMVGHLMNFPDRLHEALSINLFLFIPYHLFSNLKNRIILRLSAN